MLALTTLSPNRLEHQLKCIETWVKNGLEVIAFNDEDFIKDVTGITFVKPKEYFEYKKKYVSLNTFINFIKNTDKNCCIINSDIELINAPDLSNEMNKGIICVNRYDYDKDITLSSRWGVGFDIFYINNELAHIYSENKFVIGQCHYDYWIPYKAIKTGIKVFNPEKQFAFHKKHVSNNQYSNGNWKKTALHFISLEQMNFPENEQGCWAMNKYVFDIINANLIKI